MVRKIMWILLALILVCIVGISYLILFVNPNHFRQFITTTITEKTGYQLTIQGDLRWHIWPQISILTGPVELQEKTAHTPVLSADNMRLDVAVWPLFDKKLEINSIFVKSATLNISNDRKGNISKTVATLPGEKPNPTRKISIWSYDLKNIEIADATVIWQINDKQKLTFRKMNVHFERNEQDKIKLHVTGILNRNQRDFHYDAEAVIDTQNYPLYLPVHIHKFTYRIEGIGLPQAGLSGSLTGTVNYQHDPLRIQANNILLDLGKDLFNGKIIYDMANGRPYIHAEFVGNQLDFRPYTFTSENEKGASHPLPAVMHAPDQQNELRGLTQFDGDLTLNIGKILIRNLQLDDNFAHITNHAGQMQLNPMSFKVGGGTAILVGHANGNSAQTDVAFRVSAANVALAAVLKALNISSDIGGTLTGKGNFKTDSIRRTRWLKDLVGNLDLMVKGARLNNLNIQQIVQMATAQVANDISTTKLQKYTEFHELTTKGDIMDGRLKLNPIVATSEALNANGWGDIDLLAKKVDIALTVQLKKGDLAQNTTTEKWQNFKIPLRIYGNLSDLHYQVDLNKILREQWKNSLNKLKEKYFSS